MLLYTGLVFIPVFYTSQELEIFLMDFHHYLGQRPRCDSGLTLFLPVQKVPQWQQLPPLVLARLDLLQKFRHCCQALQKYPMDRREKDKVTVWAFGLPPICWQGKVSPNVAESFKSPAEIVCEEGELLTV